MPYLRTHGKAIHRIIGASEVLGAAWSLDAFIGLLLRTSHVTLSWAFLLAVMGGFGLVGLAGVLLLRGSEVGEYLSAAVQTLQVVQLTLGGISYRFVAGAQVSVFFLGDRFTAFAGLTATANLRRGDGDPNLAIGVNLVSLVMLMALIALADSDASRLLPEQRERH